MTITDTIYKTIEAENKQWTPIYHNPSSAMFRYSNGEFIGPDMLSLYYKWTGVKPSNPMDAKSIVKMEMGNAAHEVVAKILAKAGIKAKSEVKGKSSVPGLKFPVSYRVDGLHELNGNLEVLEVKSSTDQQMFGKGWGIKDKGPKDDHLLQVICYLNLEPGLNRARLLYISRDSGDFIEYEVLRQPEDKYTINGYNLKELNWAGIIKQWQILETHLEKKEPPEPSYSPWLNDSNEIMAVKQIKGVKYKSPWRCEYDSYRDLIWKDPKNFKFTQNAKFGVAQSV